MSREKVILITGSNGEIGNNLINYFAKSTNTSILSLDLQPLENTTKVKKHIVGSILNKEIIEDINADYEISSIYHLAAMLSTKSEFSPFSANEVNVNGTLNLIDLAIKQSITKNHPVKFFFPSSIAVYGIDKNNNNPIKENECLFPKTIYGMNKLYCEQLGIYFANNYHRLTKDYKENLLDFRSIRFPGLISVITKPTGGTSDYIPGLLHAAAENQETYTCFVSEKAQLPFMVMPDAINAICKLMSIQKSYLKHEVYNISAFSPTVEQFYNKLLTYFPNLKIEYEINDKREEMVSGWPSQVDCSRALYDWNWEPKYNLDNAFSEYFIPHLKSKIFNQ